ncbi:MAG: 16S rRNA (cytosine(967)-C(5))-methyltransferase RsmB [Candidatus Lokiarchaeota archaeon]|nr:16S rRNA (cytosine(967)-C(5))-methyltransferase RsmB [Candidatus Lokiarchaeota archaeon]
MSYRSRKKNYIDNSVEDEFSVEKKPRVFDKEEIATEVLVTLELENISEREAIKKIMRKHEIEDWRIRGSAHRLTLETLRKLNVIDKIIKKNLKDRNSFAKLDPFLRNLLRVTVFQMKFSDKAPELITNQALEIYKRRKKSQKQVNFLNAILRQIEKKQIEQYFKGNDYIENLSLQHFQPSWLIKYMLKYYDKAFTEEFIKQRIPPYFIRINTIKISINKALEKLEEENFEFEEVKGIPECIKITNSFKPVTRSLLYLKGMIYIQSKSSMIVSKILEPKKGEVIADLCASPGSKTTHIAQLMENEGSIIAIERNINRIPELHKNINKLGIKIVQIINADSFLFNNFIRIEFDKILIDPPCSGTGTFDSRPITKWKFTPRDISRNIHVQEQILMNGSKKVKVGGILVYSTCSILIEENERVIQKFLDHNQNYKILNIKKDHGMEGLENFSQALRLYPHVDDSEGFFVAKLKRIT